MSWYHKKGRSMPQENPECQWLLLATRGLNPDKKSGNLIQTQIPSNQCPPRRKKRDGFGHGEGGNRFFLPLPLQGREVPCNSPIETHLVYMPEKLPLTYTFCIDKELHWTSFDVVKKIRVAMREKKVGHAGTLDPLATGLVLVCTGKATKTIDSLMGQDKEYTGTIRLGATTPSYDLETEPDALFPTDHITEDQIRAVAASMTGPQLQVPPMFSALKVDGKKLYELARKGKETHREPRSVVISEFEITGIRLPDVDFRVWVSKGTYIRSLAFDFGQACGSGAHLVALRRTRIGNLSVNDARTIPQWLEWWQSEAARLLSAAEAEDTSGQS
jgi:tRNA pseudouridine55 synthase